MATARLPARRACAGETRRQAMNQSSGPRCRQLSPISKMGRGHTVARTHARERRGGEEARPRGGKHIGGRTVRGPAFETPGAHGVSPPVTASETYPVGTWNPAERNPMGSRAGTDNRRWLTCRPRRHPGHSRPAHTPHTHTHTHHTVRQQQAIEEISACGNLCMRKPFHARFPSRHKKVSPVSEMNCGRHHRPWRLGPRREEEGPVLCRLD